MRRDLAVEPIRALPDPDTLEELREWLGRDRLLPAVAEGWERGMPRPRLVPSAREGTPMWTECSAYGTMNLPGCLPVTPANLATGAAPDPGIPSFSRERLLTGRSRWHSRALP